MPRPPSKGDRISAWIAPDAHARLMKISQELGFSLTDILTWCAEDCADCYDRNKENPKNPIGIIPAIVELQRAFSGPTFTEQAQPAKKK